MKYGRRSIRLFDFKDDLYHFAPIPFVYHIVADQDIKEWHKELISDAIRSYDSDILEVPDERHINQLGTPPEAIEQMWIESAIPAVGVWHRVPTNQFLNLETDAVKRLNTLILSRYRHALLHSGIEGSINPSISESWIQFYKTSDYKVLHNHERYGPPYPPNRWAGAYYIDDGQPDANMPYSGVLSFRVRSENHFIRPKPGLLIMWPADILHEVHPFYGDRERIVVNFNVNSDEIDWSNDA